MSTKTHSAIGSLGLMVGALGGYSQAPEPVIEVRTLAPHTIHGLRQSQARSECAAEVMRAKACETELADLRSQLL